MWIMSGIRPRDGSETKSRTDFGLRVYIGMGI